MTKTKDAAALLRADETRDGKWLKRARLALGFSQSKLAERLHMKGGSRSVRKYELGERPVSGPVGVAVEGFLRDHAGIAANG